MSASLVRLKASIFCSRRQGRRVVNGIKTMNDIHEDKAVPDEPRFLAFFDRNPVIAKAKIIKLAEATLGIEALFDEQTNTLEIQESFAGANPSAVAKLLQALLPRNLPIEFSYTIEGQTGWRAIKVTRDAITERDISEAA